MTQNKTPSNEGIIRDITRTKVTNSSTYGEFSKKSTTASSERPVFVGITPKFGPFTISVQNCDGIDVIMVNGLELYKFEHGDAVYRIVSVMAPSMKAGVLTPTPMSPESVNAITTAVGDLLELQSKKSEPSKNANNATGFSGFTKDFGTFKIDVKNTPAGDVIMVNDINLSAFSNKEAAGVVQRYVRIAFSAQGFLTASQATEAREELSRAVTALLATLDKEIEEQDKEGQPGDGFVFIGLGTVQLDVGDGFLFEYSERQNKKPLVLLNQKKLKSHTVDIKPVRDVAAFLLNQFGAHGESIDAFIIGTLNGIAKIHQSEKAERKAEKKERKTDGPASL